MIFQVNSRLDIEKMISVDKIANAQKAVTVSGSNGADSHRERSNVLLV